MYQPIQLKTPTVLFLVALLLACFVVPQTAQAVVPPPDGGYPNFTTAEGDNALRSLTTGVGNTAIGTFSLSSVTTGSFNTAVGAGALDLNTADNNTATGAAALLLNTGGHDNTANGVDALALNDTGSQNTANGAFALFSNTTGNDNTAMGVNALLSNTSGNFNIAVGKSALSGNTTGIANIAVGDFALFQSTTGSSNVALGSNSGVNVTTANNVICLGANALGENVNSSCYISNIFAKMSAGGINVLVNSNGKLGTTVSSQRFKDDIKPMERASEALLALKPVTFRYKKEIDPAGTSQFGLVAEEVEKVNPDLVVRDQEGKPYTVRYDQVNAMLLNEFLKAHHKVEEQGASITQLNATVAQQQKDFTATAARQQEQIEALTAGLHKVSAQLGTSRPAPQMVFNNQ